MLDLADILSGATSGTIAQFQNVTNDGTDSTMTVDANGSGLTDLTIETSGVVIGNGQDVQDLI